MTTVVTENMNEAEVAIANAENAKIVAETKTQEVVAQAEVTNIEAGAEPSGEMSMGDGDASLMGHTGGDDLSSGNGKSLSTEGGLAADIAVEALGGTGVQIAKTGIDALRDIDPAGKGVQTMENFAAPKASASASGKKSIFTEGQSSLSQLFGGVQIAGDSLNGDTPVKGAKADVQKSTQAFQNTIQFQRSLGLESAQQLGNGIQHQAKLGAQAHQARQMGIAPGPAGLDLASRAPKGPTHMTDEETGAVA